MAYSTIDNPKVFFNTVLYTGTGSSLAVTGVGFQPNWTWIKSNSATTEHVLTDSIRGVTKELSTNDTGAEETVAQGLTAFGSDGFTVGTDGSYNTDSATYVSWNWKAGTSFTNDASSTGVGSIDSTGSFNNDAGFSIVSWVGTGSNGTIKHGMNIVPRMIILKDRSNSRNWQVYHAGFGNSGSGQLNLNAAFSADGMFQSTDPTSSVFSVGTSVNANASSANIIAYCLAEVKGYSKFGSYVGNGNANGTFVYTGFKPAFIIWKRTQDSGYDWDIYDTARDTHNVAFKELLANANGAESDGTTLSLDILSNGFKLRTNNNNGNASGKTYIYMAFAENPFVNSKGIPNNAR
tara:strand:+ start:625 stop:1671 length:1047 start_codon:yes stop_codon:yes gene_type:complete